MGRDHGRHETTIIVEEDLNEEQGYASGPERALMTALLFDGVQAYLSYIFARSASQREKNIEAYRWIETGDSDYVFAFENVCEALGIDPNGLRLGLANFITSYQQSTEDEYRRSRRTF